MCYKCKLSVPIHSSVQYAGVIIILFCKGTEYVGAVKYYLCQERWYSHV